MLTQRQRVINELELHGAVSNFWAIEHYILRLGSVIHSLKDEGYEFEGCFGKVLGHERGQWKNYYYKLIKTPYVDDCTPAPTQQESSHRPQEQSAVREQRSQGVLPARVYKTKAPVEVAQTPQQRTIFDY